jgi:hypothetical protein
LSSSHCPFALTIRTSLDTGFRYNTAFRQNHPRGYDKEDPEAVVAVPVAAEELVAVPVAEEELEAEE